MLGAPRRVEQCLRLRIHSPILRVEEDVADPLCDRCTTRLARNDDVLSLLLGQPVVQELHLRRLAGPLNTFERDEKALARAAGEGRLPEAEAAFAGSLAQAARSCDPSRCVNTGKEEEDPATRHRDPRPRKIDRVVGSGQRVVAYRPREKRPPRQADEERELNARLERGERSAA